METDGTPMISYRDWARPSVSPLGVRNLALRPILGGRGPKFLHGFVIPLRTRRDHIGRALGFPGPNARSIHVPPGDSVAGVHRSRPSFSVSGGRACIRTLVAQ